MSLVQGCTATTTDQGAAGDGDGDGDSAGLAPEEIAGIVIGVLVALGLVSSFQRWSKNRQRVLLQSPPGAAAPAHFQMHSNTAFNPQLGATTVPHYWSSEFRSKFATMSKTGTLDSKRGSGYEFKTRFEHLQDDGGMKGVCQQLLDRINDCLS